MSGQTDEFRHLLREVQNGSHEATRELIESYGPHIIRAVRRKLNKAIRPKFDSIDFVQAVWASFFASPRPLTDFEGPGELVGYLATLAHHKVIDEIRRRMESEKYNVNREQSLNGSVTDISRQFPASQPSPSEVAVAEELWARMVRGKPEHHQRILQLRREGNSYQQIADQLGVNEKTVRRVIQAVLPEQD
jgi:RNA polymerase sigma-70 factor (ECF subfamily)